MLVDRAASLFYSGTINARCGVHSRRTAVLVGALVLGITFPPEASLQDHVADIEAWRSAREEALKADDSWLTVAGLFFLHEGDNSFGAGPLNDIVLPAGPSEAGVFVLENRVVTLHAAPGSTLVVDGEHVTTAPLHPREQRAEIQIGTLTLFVHRSGDRLAIRMRDINSVIRTRFAGLRWYPVDEGYRVPARFISHAEPMTVLLQNILGDVETFTSYGSVRLSVHGQSFDMLPVESDGRLWFIFRDLTSGKETYAAARFLYANAPEDGWTVVDFNKAYNPPCAFNPHTTCPLPPTANRLPVRIEAGEQDYEPVH